MEQLDILQAVQAKLTEAFNYPIYLDETKEGFQSPCFFLKAIRTTNRDNHTYHKNNVSIYVTFFSEKGTLLAEDLYTIQDTLFTDFTYGFYLLNKRLFLLTENLHAEIDGEDSDIILFSFDVKYFDVAPSTTEYETANTLHLQERYE